MAAISSLNRQDALQVPSHEYPHIKGQLSVECSTFMGHAADFPDFITFHGLRDDPHETI